MRSASRGDKTPGVPNRGKGHPPPPAPRTEAGQFEARSGRWAVGPPSARSAYPQPTRREAATGYSATGKGTSPQPPKPGDRRQKPVVNQQNQSGTSPVAKNSHGRSPPSTGTGRAQSAATPRGNALGNLHRAACSAGGPQEHRRYGSPLRAEQTVTSDRAERQVFSPSFARPGRRQQGYCCVPAEPIDTTLFHRGTPPSTWANRGTSVSGGRASRKPRRLVPGRPPVSIRSSEHDARNAILP